MEHIKALIIKFGTTFLILGIVLSLYGINYLSIIWISMVITLGAYIFGDLLLLPKSNNLLATLDDMVLAWGGIWLLGSYFVKTPINWAIASLISALFIGLSEWVFHRYLADTVLKKEAKIY